MSRAAWILGPLGSIGNPQRFFGFVHDIFPLHIEKSILNIVYLLNNTITNELITHS